MKTHLISLVSVLTLWSLMACSTKKILTSQKDLHSAIRAEDTQFEKKQTLTYQVKNAIRMMDSTRQLYQVHIVPLDTFTYSMQHGFKGKAAFIEAVGIEAGFRTVTDSSLSAMEEQADMSYSRRLKNKEEDTTSKKALQQSKRKLWPVIIGIGVLGLLWWWFQSRQRALAN